MTEIELLKNRLQELIDRCPLERGDAPLLIGNVSYTQYSVVRHSGGCRINGVTYIYEIPVDALIREDVHAWMRKEWYKKEQATTNTAEQLSLL